jgi:hypothetical protein
MKKTKSSVKIVFLSGLLWTDGTSEKESDKKWSEFGIETFTLHLNEDFLSCRSLYHCDTKRRFRWVRRDSKKKLASDSIKALLRIALKKEYVINAK